MILVKLNNAMWMFRRNNACKFHKDRLNDRVTIEKNIFETLQCPYLPTKFNITKLCSVDGHRNQSQYIS